MVNVHIASVKDEKIKRWKRVRSRALVKSDGGSKKLKEQRGRSSQFFHFSSYYNYFYRMPHLCFHYSSTLNIFAVDGSVMKL